MENPGQGEQSCIFCQIVEGKINSNKVYEDDLILAILDIYPANPGHILVLPKKHYSLMMQMTKEETGHMFSVIKKLSNVVLRGLDYDATNIFVANGAAAGQKAPHFMAHIIPRKENDGLDFSFREGKSDEDSLEKLRSSLVYLIKEAFGLDINEIKKFYPEFDPEHLQKQKGADNENPPKQASNEQSATKQSTHEQSSEQTEKNQNKPTQKSTPEKSDEVNLDDISNMFK